MKRAPVLEASFSRRAVLLVDDDPPTLTLMRSMVAVLFPSLEILTASDGERALDLVSDHVSCIVSDIDMPGLDGFRLCWAIRNSPLYRPWRRLPVILVSALYTEEEAVRRAWDAGTALVLPKPFPPAALARAVARTTGIEPGPVVARAGAR